MGQCGIQHSVAWIVQHHGGVRTEKVDATDPPSPRRSLEREEPLMRRHMNSVSDGNFPVVHQEE